MDSRLRQRRPLLWLTMGSVALALLLLITVWLLSGGTRGAETANVLALPLTVMSLGVTIVFGVAAQRQVGDTADADVMAAQARQLAGAVRAAEEAELGRLLADTGDVEAAELRFVQPSRRFGRTDGGPSVGNASCIEDYYRALERGRLVICGPAGSGKSVLAIRLVRDLAEAAQSTPAFRPPGDARRGVAVPLRLSAPTFTVPAGRHPAGERLAELLDTWLIEHLVLSYRVPRSAATVMVMVMTGLIVPVIDGVDEMDPPGEPPDRAAALLTALNQPTPHGARAAVVTCRIDRYAQLAAASASDIVDHVLQDATVVCIEPMAPSRVREYLSRRFSDPGGSDGGDPRLHPLLKRLAAEKPDDPVVAMLQSPLRLFLAVTALRSPETDPAEVIRRLEGERVDSVLLAGLIPALVARQPRSDGGRYSTRDVTRWLTTLARHLRSEELAGRSGTDLRFDTMWRAAGDHATRYITAVVLAATAALPLFLLWIRHLVPVGLPRDAFIGAGVAISLALFLFAVRNSLRQHTRLQRLDIRQIGTSRGARSFGLWVAAGLSIGLGFGVSVDFAGGFAAQYGAGTDLMMAVVFGLLGGLAFGVSLGIAFGLAARPEAIAAPGQLVRQGVAHSIALLTVGLSVGLSFALAAGPTMGLVFGLLFGVVAISASPWPRYGLACIFLAIRNDAPFRLAHFVDWAYAAGLVRLAGTSMQFRHRELQMWLTGRLEN